MKVKRANEFSRTQRPPARLQPAISTLDEHKFRLPFILNVNSRLESQTHQSIPDDTVAIIPSSRSGRRSATLDAKATLKLSKEEKKLRRTCKHEGCHNYIVHKGLCCRHGGGKKCSLEGCNTSAKHRGLCWKHGVSVACKVDECNRKAKSHGLCWSHGGGTKCENAECSKVAVSNGFCWAHGSEKRCEINDCIKPAYERTHKLCEKHFLQARHANYYELYTMQES